jgi:hypothetical protein
MYFPFGKRKRRLAASSPAGARRSDPRSVQERSPQWRAWREAAQRVTRTWNEWSASDRPHRGKRYESYLSAVAAEERAALRLEHALTGAADEDTADAAESDQPVAPRRLGS